MQQTPGERFVERARPAILPVLVVIGVALLVVHARQRLTGTDRFTVDPTAWEVRSRPDWLSDELAVALAHRISTGLADRSSLLDVDGLDAWHDDLLAASPWIETVERIEPRFPGQADVRLRLRRPVMSVAEDILLSASGHVLGAGATSIEPAPLRFEGAHSDEAALRESAAAAAELVPFRAELDSLGVHVERVGIDRDDTVIFRTDRDVVLSWGRSAGESGYSYLDLPFRARIDNLRMVLVDYPGLAGVERIQLWTDKPVVHTRGG
ncbi:MAG: cell division protein FtsQ/DivIB [Planctomycetota bacterium]|jgi:hypothetical protein